MNTICLVTNEIYPITHGGCGTLIYNSIYSLLESNFRVILLADIEQDKLTLFKENCISHFQNLSNFEIYCIPTLINSSDKEIDSLHNGIRQSWRFYKGLQLLTNFTKLDIVEIPDYFGYGYHTLLNKHELPKYTKVFIRFHLTMEWIDQAVPQLAPVGENRILTYGLERWCLKQADCVLAPTEVVANKIKEFYQPKQILVSAPAFSGLNIIHRKPALHKNRILFYARLAPQKGADLFVNAVLEWIKDFPDDSHNVRFTIAGPDMDGGPGGISTALHLQRIIPLQHRKYFEFLGNLNRQALDHLLPTVLFAVFPTHSETYCYAARELAMAGVPLICSDIPELSDLVNEGLAISAPLDLFSWKQAINQLYSKFHHKKYADKYWEPSDTLSAAYIVDLPIENQITQPTQDEICVLFFIFSTDDSEDKNFPLKEALSQVSFRHQLIIAYPDETGNFPLRNKQWRLSSETPESFNILCFLERADIVSADYLNWAIEKFKLDSRVGIITCSCRSEFKEKDTIPWHAAPTLLPFKDNFILKRALLRVDNSSRSTCFDPFMLELHEISGIWKILEQPEAKWIHTEKWEIETKINERNINPYDINRQITSLLTQNLKKKNLPLLDVTLIHLLMNSYDIVDIPLSLRQGRTPEAGGVRYNLAGILKLLVLRLKGVNNKFLTKLQLNRIFSNGHI